MACLIAAGGESSGNCPESHCFLHPACLGLPAGAGLGRASPAKLDADARLRSAPFAQAGVILAAGFIGHQECGWRALPARHAGALPGCSCAVGRYGEGLGAVGASGDPPRVVPGSCQGAGGAFFRQPRRGRPHFQPQPLPACKSGGDDKWRRGIWAGSRWRSRAGAALSLRQSRPDWGPVGCDAQEPWLGQGVEGLGVTGSPPEAVPNQGNCGCGSGWVLLLQGRRFSAPGMVEPLWG